MSRHQTHPRNVHPYQSTLGSRAETHYLSSTQQRQYKNILVKNSSQDGLSSNSCSDSETYHGSHQYTNVRPPTSWSTHSHSDGLSSPVYHTPMHEDVGPTVYSKPYASNTDMSVYNMPVGMVTGSGSECCESVVHASPPPLALASEVPGGCGGHCPGFEYVCYYVLQITFVIGILTGISLCIAGGVLKKSNRSGDLGVLVYIGVLSFLVCLLLLCVQCFVRRGNKRRNKHLRIRTGEPDVIQLDTIPNLTIDDHGVSLQNTPVPQPMQVAVPPGTYNPNMQPLLYPTAHSTRSTIPRDYYRTSQRYHQRIPPASIPHDELNGVPWWRMQQASGERR